MAANSYASDGAAPNRPSIAPARAVVLTSLIQLVAIAMNLRLRHRRSLRAIERNLADSDPSLTRDSTALRLFRRLQLAYRRENHAVHGRPMTLQFQHKLSIPTAA